MAYFLSNERNEDVVGSYRRYQQYLREHKDRFPAGAFALATADWWYEPSDHRCPHDAWLEHLSIFEPARGERNEDRSTRIEIRLLGAYHDGYIELSYPHVYGYQMQSPSCERGLGDWRYDEFTLSPKGHIIHEIEWAGFGEDKGSRWIIEASDITFEWMPK